MSHKKGPDTAPSESPPEDLKKERDAFIQQFFRKGAQLTEELLKENERLRDRIAELDLDNQRLRTHLASDSAMRELLIKIEQLEAEKKELLHRSVAIAAESGQFSNRYVEVESELSNLANLFVATTQLHGAGTVRRALHLLKELLAQLLGAGAYAIYLVSEDGRELVALSSEGIAAKTVARLPATEGPVGRAFAHGEIKFDSVGDVSRGTVDAPAAVIPLRLDGAPVGAIAIFTTLPQKTEFVESDGDLFRLLSVHAAPALVHAKLFTDAHRKLPSVQAFLDPED